MAQIKMRAKVIHQEKLGDDIYSMVIAAPEIAALAMPGQFISVYCKDGGKLLPRPISLCEIKRAEGTVRIVYRIAGNGTREFSTYKDGDDVEIMGPLGNGFPILHKKALVIGGGIGIPPMLELARSLKGSSPAMVLGYRDQLFLMDEFTQYGQVFVATEDGSAGTKGNVLDAIRAEGLSAQVIYACGPTPMLLAVKNYAEENGIPCYLSLEERMACGIGACLACVCKSKELDDHSQVHNKRVCKDGPVFLSGEVEL